MRYFVSTVLGMALGIAMPQAAADDSPDDTKPILERPWLLGAHRGGAAWRPESTLLAYRDGHAMWPEMVLEADIRLTKDGVAVILHDDTVDRTTDGEGLVAEMTFEEVRALDAGYTFSPDGGETFPYRGKGVQVPTLEEILTAFPDAHWLLETKPAEGVVDEALRVIAEVGATERVSIGSFIPAHIDQIREEAPGIATCFSIFTVGELLAALRGDEESWAAYTPKDDILAVPYDSLATYNLGKEDLERVQSKGILIQVHTVNDEADMQAMLDLGVDAVLTDYPDVLSRIIDERSAAASDAGGA